MFKRMQAQYMERLPRKIRHLSVFILIFPIVLAQALLKGCGKQKQSVFLLCTFSPIGKPAGIGCRWLHVRRRMCFLTVACSVCMIKQQSMVSCASLAVVTGRSMILQKYLPFLHTKVTAEKKLQEARILCLGFF